MNGPDTRDGEHRSTLARLRFLVTPRWIALIVGAIAFALACYLILAPWQFGRNAERSERNAAIAAAIAADPVPIDRLMSTDTQPGQHAIWHEVRVTGTFDASREAYIRLRQDNDGDPANEVVVPLVTADGTAVLIDRGYVPLISVRNNTPLPALPSGTVTVTGRVQADQTDPKHRPPTIAPDGRKAYTAASSELAGPGPVYRGYLQLTAGSPAVIAPIGLPQRDAGPFFSYALQWLTFGAIAVLGIGYFIYREFAEPSSGEIYLPEPDEGGDGESRGGTGEPDGPGGDGVARASPERQPDARPAANRGAPAGGAVDGAATRDRSAAAGTGAVGAGADATPAGAGRAAAASSPGRESQRGSDGDPAPDGDGVLAAVPDGGRSAAAGRRETSPRRRRRRGGFDKSQLYDRD